MAASDLKQQAQKPTFIECLQQKLDCKKNVSI
jgi:hypothetical protein